MCIRDSVEPKRQTYKELDARNAQPPKRWQVTAPEGAPNVVIVLIDDMGFGASSAFGGPINMPNLDKVAAKGLKYNRFHTTLLCLQAITTTATMRDRLWKPRRHFQGTTA